MYKEKIIDIATGKETYRDFTIEEIAQMEKNEQEAAQFVLENKKRENARASALAKLAALGLTEDEIAAL